MLDNFSSLTETAERFNKSPETIWNLSLQFQDQLQPELGENGLIAYSPIQRETIGKILNLQMLGFSYQEILNEISAPPRKSCTNITQEQLKPNIADTICLDQGQCKQTILKLSRQVEFLWKQVSQLKQTQTDTSSTNQTLVYNNIECISDHAKDDAKAA